MNSNGILFAEVLMRDELILIKRIFPHKVAHRTTWESPMRNTENGNNPYRDQLDYIVV